MKTILRTSLLSVAVLMATLTSGAVADEYDEKLPEGAKLVAIEAQPPSVTLKHRYDYTQLLLVGRLDSGDSVDVTRMVQTEPSDLVTVSPHRLIRPKQNGKATIRFSLAGQSVEVPVEVRDLDAPYEVNFACDVQPALSKMGCNAGTCHGSKAGKNGFKLSLRGYDPLFDHRAFTDDMASRRINRAAPANSLMLLKATGSVPHVGGMVTKPGEVYYEMIRSWIAGGLKLDLTAPRVKQIEIFPKNPVVQRKGLKQQMRVLATYADGLVRDVTAESSVETGNQDVAIVDPQSVVTVLRRGEAPILARFEGAYAATTVTVMGDRGGFTWQEPEQFNELDTLVAAKLLRMKTLASGICTDNEFVRRLYLDLTGLPPTPEVVQAFVDDPRDRQIKRDAMIDRLVGSAEYIEHWSNKWAELLQVNRKFLGKEGSVSLRNWIKQAIASNMPYDKFVYEILTASGSNRDNPAASYYKILRTPEDALENTTQLFLAVRFSCNKCHDHPFERWTQDQYYNMAAYFAQVGIKKDPAGGDRVLGRTAVVAAKPLFEVIYDKDVGEVTHDRTGVVTPPAFPYEHKSSAAAGQSRREQLARWVISKDNRYFAKSYVNRLWGYLLGVGIIEPLDDIRAGNPPTNPELLEALTQQFKDSNFDVKDLVRTICKSATYQRSIATNQWNEDDKTNYSHATARRLSAEVLYDAVHRVTGAPTRLPGMPEGMRAAELPDVGVKLPSGFLDKFGRPARESACECERVTGMMLGPVMALVNGPTIADAIASPQNAITKLVAREKDDAKVINVLFMRILSRPATANELEAGTQALHSLKADHTKVVAALKAYELTLPAKLAAWEKQQHDAEWTVLEPTELSATNGATLTKEDSVELLAKGENGSIFVAGKNGKGQYQVEASTDLAGITGFRLEPLADKRLPAGGPGRAQNGNFVLHEFTVEAASKADPKKTAKVGLQNADADFSQTGFSAAAMIDGSNSSGWAISPQMGKSRIATFETASDIGFTGGTVLTFTLDQQHDALHTIGRFRILVTTSPRPIRLQGPPAAIEAIVKTKADQRTAAQKAALLAHFRSLDGKLKELEAAVQTSTSQLANERLLGAQDVTWALINSPAFLFNR